MSFNYNPYEYWRERGKVYQKNFTYDRSKRLQEETLIKYLTDNIFSSDDSIKSVLELGCGFGRISKLLLTNFPTIKEYLAVDLSPHQLENAKNYVGSANNKISFFQSDIQTLNTNNKKYDLVIASEVLLHIIPSEIEHVLKKIISLSNKHIVNVDWYEDNSLPFYKKRAPHNFIHQYESIYKKYTEPGTIITRIPIKSKKFLRTFDTRQSIFHVIL
jgi:2-polyprenyl-3-methyl-5-hydroxy-6-metoxy-1,4-benzoquinol methylase